MPDPGPTAWVRSYAAGLAPVATAHSRVRWVTTPSGARLAFVAGPAGRDVLVKLHHPRTDRRQLTERLAAVSDPSISGLFVPPLAAEPATAPDGAAATAWPVVEVLGPEDDIPWAVAGRLLARLHSAPLSGGLTRHDLPRHDPAARLRRAVTRARDLADPVEAGLLTSVGTTLLREVAEATLQRGRAQRHTPESTAPQGNSIIHGDWHLGQLGHWDGAWRLLDVDDLAVGDPLWDLARPAGFWAAGLLDDEAWSEFLRGHGVRDDPWPRLDLPARCAVLVAAVRAAGAHPAHRDLSADSLLEACRRM